VESVVADNNYPYFRKIQPIKNLSGGIRRRGKRHSALARSIDDESDLKIDAIAFDGVVFNVDLLFLDPGATDVVNGFGGFLNAFSYRILETFGRLAADFNDLGD
jgi:hypothetical protein